jgi:hypothetical protein
VGGPLRLEHVYRMRFSYRRHRSIGARRSFGLAEGACNGG